MKTATKVKNLQTGVTQNQVNDFCKKHKDYIFYQILDYPCQSGSGMRSKIILRHKDAIVKTLKHPVFDASVELIEFSLEEIEAEFKKWCESI